ncbi:MAG: anti-sigma factor family protein [Acidimicrobiales bacterium]
MSSHDCDHVKGLIALSVIDRLPAAERVGLLAHLDGCPECREDERDLRTLSSALPAADVAYLEESQVPAGLSQAVLGGLSEAARRERRTRRVRYVVGAAAAAAAIAVLALVAVPGSPTAHTKTVALSGTDGVHATVVLTAKAWGTSVQIDETGQQGRSVLSVLMRTKSGGWWPAGTYRSASGHSLQVDLACALKLSQIESVWIRNSSGHAVLHGYV